MTAVRFRYDCEQHLGHDEFVEVEELLHAVSQRLAQWFRAHEVHTESEMAEVISVLTYAEDPNQRVIRENAADLAMFLAGIPRPRTSGPEVLLSTNHAGVIAALQQVSPQAAGFLLAEAITGLSHTLVGMMRGDQLQGEGLLGVRFPENALAIRRAVSPDAWLTPPRDYVYRSDRRSITRRTRRTSSELLAVIQRLLRGRAQKARADELLPQTQTGLAKLVELEILDFYDGVYRISRIAHYSTFAVGGGHPSRFKASVNGRRSPVPSRDATSAI